MPISYTYNTVFIHIPKCAGTTIEKILGTSSTEEFFDYNQRQINNTKKTPQHFTYAELKSQLDINWSDYYVFSVVRNPYSRFISEYKALLAKSKVSSVSELVEKLQIQSDLRIQQFDGHLETQSTYLKNESGGIDSSINVFKFENMTPCWEMLGSKTEVDYSDSYWSRKSEDETPYQQFYTDETKAAVYDFYKEDFQNFQYNSEL